MFFCGGGCTGDDYDTRRKASALSDNSVARFSSIDAAFLAVGNEQKRLNSSVEALLDLNENGTCVHQICQKSSSWCDVELGCFLCTKCAAVHRSLPGCRIMSVSLDNFTETQCEKMRVCGNAYCRNILFSDFEVYNKEKGIPWQKHLRDQLETHFSPERSRPDCPSPIINHSESLDDNEWRDAEYIED